MKISEKKSILKILQDIQEIMPQTQNTDELQERIERAISRLKTYELDNTEVISLTREDMERYFQDPDSVNKIDDDMLESIADDVHSGLTYDIYWELLGEVLDQGYKDDILSN